MRVIFAAIGCEQLGVSLLAALLRARGHEVGLAFSAALFDDRYILHVPRLATWFDDTAAVVDSIVSQAPDIVAFSAITNTYRWMIEVAGRVKALRPEVVVVFGGVHATAVPELVANEAAVDYVCVGEGERALLALVDAIAAGGPRRPIDNLVFRNGAGTLIQGPIAGFFADLDSLPFGDKRIWEDYVRVGDLYMIMTSRGCPYRCTYCHNSFSAKLPDAGRQRGKYCRRRSIEHVLAELEQARRRYRLHCVDFVDDIFTSDRGWLKQFLPRYRREIGVPFNCIAHAQHMDEEVASWLGEAGCEWVQLGIQTVDDVYKREQLGRRETLAEIERAMSALSRHHIKVKADHIFGLPGEPVANQRRAAAFYTEMTPARISTFWATYFPATEMTRRAHASGVIDDDDLAAIERGELAGYHDRGTVAPAQVALFRACELHFRLLPLLPRWLRRRVTVDAVGLLPARSAWLLGLVADAINGLRMGNHDHLSYAAHYLYHYYRQLCARLGVEPAPATSGARRGEEAE